MNTGSALRMMRRAGWAILIVAIPILVFEPSARPSAQSLVVIIIIAAAIGLLAGLATRSRLASRLPGRRRRRIN
jgi:hypothetical protein